jgi:hypothetical protein
MEMMKTIKTSCKAMKPDGKPCQAAALPGSGFCFFHDPAKAKERRAARSFGGSQNRMKTLANNEPDVKIEDCRGVVSLISETINQVRRGQIDPRIANAIGYLSTVLLKAVETGEMEGRLIELESLVKARFNEPVELTLTGTNS